MTCNWFLSLAGAVTLVKMLLIPAYHSTDFEVHRNWLAITHSLPLSKWYNEATSEWTLDYPPFFAYFERFLSIFAGWFDPNMLVIQKEAYDSPATVFFQRLSVIVADILFMYGVKQLCEQVVKYNKPLEVKDFASHPSFILAVLLVGNFGLLLVDHIHFQYNGFLFGMQLLSIVNIWQGNDPWGAFWFATLLNFKHIYLYVAPAYFIYLLRCYCFRQSYKDASVMWTSLSISRLFLLGVIVVTIFGVSFGPFVFQMEQVLSRLFPFKRGLCHAYWAPNFWALYNFIDKAAAIAAIKAGLLTRDSIAVGTMTGGLVQEFQHTVLPSIGPAVTFVLSVLSILPCLYHLWRYPNGPLGFLRCLTLCALGSFMFGWHVHEKAILMVTIPLSILAILNKEEANVFLLLSSTGHFSLFPLIYTTAETPIKVGLMLLYTIFAFYTLGTYHRSKSLFPLPLLSCIESLYILGLIPVYINCNIVYSLLGLAEKLPFLPLMITSVYCSIGVIYSWLKLYWIVLNSGKPSAEKKRITYLGDKSK
ncbi:probable dolichyl pyrophosphate Glc1Man9GlcNAc2 alpha-1,3-glucosyltransferase [Lineus longissimus]|uniref:probable dolichyl pyrophosphate Glc1Man9GlcNAc2 alpha-1,3-glucosyltransferase n=1 Tax=Lineus longissimus TaxID=88925 RepID=UPI002B4C2DCC